MAILLGVRIGIGGQATVIRYRTDSWKWGVCENPGTVRKMTFSFQPEAETEFLEAIDDYEDCKRGLGYDFSIEVFAIIQNILNYPTARPLIEEGLPRCFVRRRDHGVS